MGSDAVEGENRPKGHEGEDCRALMARARRGERSAFDVLARNYANMVTGLAGKFLGSRDEALDCAQDAFVKAWENVERYDPKWSVATWLRRIVTNLALDRLRRRRPAIALEDAEKVFLPSNVEKPDAAAERHERAESVHEILSLLTEQYSTVLILRDMEGMEIPEIAEITATNAATVRWRLHRARALFKDRWSAVWDKER